MSGSSSLDALFSPRSIAVIGASATPAKIGGRPISHLKRFGYAGPIYPVNPNAPEIQGLRAYPTVAAIGEPVDMVIVAVPAPMVLDALHDAAAAGVKAAVVFSSGFAEVSETGRAMQAEITALAEQSGMRILGPNCLGVMSGEGAVYASFTPVVLQGATPNGGIGLVSQSGAFGGFAYAMARERGLGLSHWVTTGNEADVELADCLEWLVDDPATSVVLAYMEGCRDGAALVRALKKAQAARKPVVIVKVGRTDLGAQAAASHTAALAGADAIYDAVFRQFGAYRAATIEDAFDIAYAVAVAGLPRGRTLGMLTVSGGAGVLMADAAASGGLEAPPMPQAAQDKILARVSFASARNPVDVTGQVGSDPELTPLAYELMLGEAGYDSLVMFLSASGLSPGGAESVQLAAQMRARYPDRVIALSSLFTPDLQREMDTAGVLAFVDPSRAVKAIAALAQIATAPGAAADAAVEPFKLAAGALDEVAALDRLAAADVPVVPHQLARNPDEAVAAAEALGYPVVAKIVSADILHKTEIGGVALNLADAWAVREAYAALTTRAGAARPEARLQGVLIAPMVGGGVECILGVQRDPVFGPMVMFGLGGILVEALRDVSFRMAPFDLDEAHRMIDEIRARAILDGWRGRPPADIDALAAALVALSRFAAGAGDTLESVDINPFMVLPQGKGAMALDAVLITREAN
jgi:acyl-CoA synthetase (NDP forming)